MIKGAEDLPQRACLGSRCKKKSQMGFHTPLNLIWNSPTAKKFIKIIVKMNGKELLKGRKVKKKSIKVENIIQTLFSYNFYSFYTEKGNKQIKKKENNKITW
jgi:hypothetical protein